MQAYRLTVIALSFLTALNGVGSIATSACALSGPDHCTASVQADINKGLTVVSGLVFVAGAVLGLVHYFNKTPVQHLPDPHHVKAIGTVITACFAFSSFVTGACTWAGTAACDATARSPAADTVNSLVIISGAVQIVVAFVVGIAAFIAAWTTAFPPTSESLLAPM